MTEILMNCWQKVNEILMNFLVDSDEIMLMNVWQNFDEMQMKCRLGGVEIMLMNCWQIVDEILITSDTSWTVGEIWMSLARILMNSWWNVKILMKCWKNLDELLMKC